VYTLITAANSAKAYRLKHQMESLPVLLGDYQPVPELLTRSKAIVSLPDPREDSYVHRMLTFCLDHGVDTIVPLRSEESGPLRAAAQLFSEFDISIRTDDEV
jgi:hypothetical protein